jgi:hypothetical protein
MAQSPYRPFTLPSGALSSSAIDFSARKFGPAFFVAFRITKVRCGSRQNHAPRVDPRHFTLATVAEAYRAVEDNDAAGKIVVELHE